VITGHLALAYGAGASLKERRLLWLFGAALAPDIVDVGLALARVCSPYGLYSHAIPALALQAPLAAAICWAVTRDRRVALASTLLIALHLPLDFVTGSKVFWPGAPFIGADFYRYPLADVALEVPMVLAGWWYARRRVSDSSIWLTKTVIVVLVALQCFLNVSKILEFKAPITSQSDACRASYRTR